jgi:hypothetical protein
LVLWKSTDKRGPTIGCFIQHDQLGARLKHTLRHRRTYETEPTRHSNARASQVKEGASRQIQRFGQF